MFTRWHAGLCGTLALASTACGGITTRGDDSFTAGKGGTGRGGAESTGGTLGVTGVGGVSAVAGAPGAGGASGAGGTTGLGGTSPGGGSGLAGSGPCQSEGCFCENLSDCAPTAQVSARPFGSSGWAICGAVGDSCLVSSFVETEGWLRRARCHVSKFCNVCAAPGCSAAELVQLDSRFCEIEEECRLGYDCVKQTTIDCEGPPLSECTPRVPPPESCCSGYAVSAVSGHCECMCIDSDQGPAYFDSLDLCEASCEGTPPSCDVVDPTVLGDCDQVIGMGFDGLGCRLLRGCDCEPYCASIFETWQECWMGCNRSCAEVDLARDVFREENSRCEVAEDCTWVSSLNPPFDHCSCSIALNKNANLGLWSRLDQEYGCYPDVVCCDGIPGGLACVNGRCTSL